MQQLPVGYFEEDKTEAIDIIGLSRVGCSGYIILNAWPSINVPLQVQAA